MAAKQSLPLEIARIVLPLAILAVGVVGFLAVGSRTAPASREDTGPQAPLVETVRVEPHQSGMVIETDGLVVPFREINLSAEVGGRIVYKAPECRAGRYVTKGHLLVRIDPRTYELAVERLTKELAQAEVNLQELDVEIANQQSLVQLAEEQLALQQKDLRRAEQLFQRGVATEASLDEARRNELTTRNSLVTLRNQLRTLQTRRSGLERARELVQARLAEANLNLERTEVRAPIDGVIYRDQVEQDSYVQPGTPLVVLEDISAVEVRSSLKMDELNWLWAQGAAAATAMPADQPDRDYQVPRAPATIVYRLGDREYTWQGVLHRFEGIGLDEKTRTVPCRVLVPEPRNVRVNQPPDAVAGGPRALIRGMFVEVRLHTDPQVSLLQLPERAVRPGSTVWRVRDGKLEILTVPVAQVLEDRLLIRADASRLQAGDQVVVSPLSAVSDGMPVRVAPPPGRVGSQEEMRGEAVR